MTMMMMTSRLSKWIAAVSGSAVLSTAYLVSRTPELPPAEATPSPHLLNAAAAAARLATPIATAQGRTHAFQVTVPLPPNVPIDAFASAYERCLSSRAQRYWLFRLGSNAPGRNPNAQPLPLPGLAANMRLGQPVGALSTVAAKDQAAKELLLTWVHPPSRAMGLTWLKIAPAPASPSPSPLSTPTPSTSSAPAPSSVSASVSAAKDLAKQLIAHDKVNLHLGSTLDTSACTTGGNSLFASVPAPAVDMAYKLYLRMMLLNAAIQLWWDLRHVIRPDPVHAAKAVAERVGVHVPNLPGRAPGGPMVEDRTSVGGR